MAHIENVKNDAALQKILKVWDHGEDIFGANIGRAQIKPSPRGEGGPRRGSPKRMK